MIIEGLANCNLDTTQVCQFSLLQHDALGQYIIVKMAVLKMPNSEQISKSLAIPDPISVHKV